MALEGIAHGASIVHNHTDDPMFTADGVHAAEPYVAAWQPVLDQHPDVLLYPTWQPGRAGSRCSGGGRTWASWRVSAG